MHSLPLPEAIIQQFVANAGAGNEVTSIKTSISAQQGLQGTFYSAEKDKFRVKHPAWLMQADSDGRRAAVGQPR